MCPKMLKNTTPCKVEVKITTDQIHAFSSPHSYDNGRFFLSRTKHTRKKGNKAIQGVTSREEDAICLTHMQTKVTISRGFAYSCFKSEAERMQVCRTKFKLGIVM